MGLGRALARVTARLLPSLGLSFPSVTGTRLVLLLGRAECSHLAKQLNSDKTLPGMQNVLC